MYQIVKRRLKDNVKTFLRQSKTSFKQKKRKRVISIHERHLMHFTLFLYFDAIRHANQRRWCHECTIKIFRRSFDIARHTVHLCVRKIFSLHPLTETDFLPNELRSEEDQTLIGIFWLLPPIIEEDDERSRFPRRSMSENHLIVTKGSLHNVASKDYIRGSHVPCFQPYEDVYEPNIEEWLLQDVLDTNLEKDPSICICIGKTIFLTRLLD